MSEGQNWETMPLDVHDAYLRLISAQADGQEADTIMAQSIARTSELALRREEERNEWELAGPTYRRTFYFTGNVDPKTTEATIDILSRWDHIDVTKGNADPYTIVLCSPGGDVISGMQLYSYLRSLAARRGLAIVATGMCASMATVLHQAASEGQRFIEPGTTYLLHELSASVGGRLDAITDTTEYFKKLNSEMRRIYVERGNITDAQLIEAIDRKECYLTADEVVDWGLADKIRYANGEEVL